MSVGDDFHGSEQAAESKSAPWKTVDIFLRDFPPRYREEVAELRERLRVRTELLRECLDRNCPPRDRASCKLANAIEAELALDAKDMESSHGSKPQDPGSLVQTS